MEISIPLAEPPHIVFQGEGRYTGQRMLLLRVSGCTMGCSFCDSKYTWKASENMSNIFKIVADSLENKIMITGGQPSLYIPRLLTLVKEFPRRDFFIEDDGSLDWSCFAGLPNVYFTFSPKQERFHSANTKLTYDIKMVVGDSEGIRMASEFVNRYALVASRIWIMPLGCSKNELLVDGYLQLISDTTMQYGFNLSLRNHIFIYDNKRMV